MINKSIKKILVGGLLLVSILGVGLYTNIIKLPITREISSQWIPQLNSDEGIMGASHNVFVGKIIKKVGNQSIYEIPETQFEVEVLYNVKGDLRGTTIVSQEGGYKNGILYRLNGDALISSNEPINEEDGLMKQGEVYLFVTRYSEKGKWYSILFNPGGTKLLSKDGNLDNASIKTLYEKDERVIKLKQAYKNEILLEADVKSNNTRNSYKSLQRNK